ncbi:MAG: topology modulation protein [Christensenellales bacterium]|jgi:adenylate kinase family enzyme
MLGKRIMIIGSPGSGKSTLALKLRDITGLPVIHLDREFWKAGWVETPREEWKEKQKKLLEGKEWIADGNYGGSIEIRLGLADTVIFLDYGRTLCLFRVLKRCALHLGRTRPDMAPGCKEKIDIAFLKYVWGFAVGPRVRIMDKLAKCKGMKKIILRSPQETQAFLSSL